MPRKPKEQSVSTVIPESSASAAAASAAAQNIAAQAQQDAVLDGIENYELPKSLVTRIAKSAIPDNMKLQKDTVLALMKGSTVFINYLAATAHDIASSRQHKSVSASDVLKALEQIQFGDMVDGLTQELNTYRENSKGSKKSGSKASSSKAKGKEKEAPKLSVTLKVPETNDDSVNVDGDAEMDDEEERDELEGFDVEDDAVEGGEVEMEGETGGYEEEDEMAVDDEDG